MAKYMVLIEEDDGFSYEHIYDTKKRAKKAMCKALRDSYTDGYCLPINSIRLAKIKSIKTYYQVKEQS